MEFCYCCPTTKGGMQNEGSVGICTHCIHIFARLAAICKISWCLLIKFLHWSSVASLLRAHCWLGVVDTFLIFLEAAPSEQFADVVTQSTMRSPNGLAFPLRVLPIFFFLLLHLGGSTATRGERRIYHGEIDPPQSFGDFGHHVQEHIYYYI